jgi:hypothetical protein
MPLLLTSGEMEKRPFDVPTLIGMFTQYSRNAADFGTTQDRTARLLNARIVNVSSL